MSTSLVIIVPSSNHGGILLAIITVGAAEELLFPTLSFPTALGEGGSDIVGGKDCGVDVDRGCRGVNDSGIGVCCALIDGGGVG